MRTASWLFLPEWGWLEARVRFLCPRRVRGQERTELWAGGCQQELPGSATLCFETKEVSEAEGLGSLSSTTAAQAGTVPEAETCGLDPGQDLFNIMRQNTAWPHIPWRLSSLLCPNFMADFGLSPAVITTDGRVLRPIEISDTLPTVNYSSARLQPLNYSYSWKDYQHYHCNPF